MYIYTYTYIHIYGDITIYVRSVFEIQWSNVCLQTDYLFQCMCFPLSPNPNSKLKIIVLSSLHWPCNPLPGGDFSQTLAPTMNEVLADAGGAMVPSGTVDKGKGKNKGSGRGRKGKGKGEQPSGSGGANGDGGPGNDQPPVEETTPIQKARALARNVLLSCIQFTTQYHIYFKCLKRTSHGNLKGIKHDYCDWSNLGIPLIVTNHFYHNPSRCTGKWFPNYKLPAPQVEGGRRCQDPLRVDRECGMFGTLAWSLASACC